MAPRSFNIGDKIRVIGYRPGVETPGSDDNMGTEELFQSLVGRIFAIKGFDEYGHIELQPTRLDSVWIESDLVELVAGAE
jgi:hypothetical protein